MPRFRFSIRWMMVVVAIVAIMIHLEAMRRRANHFHERSNWHYLLAIRPSFCSYLSKDLPPRIPPKSFDESMMKMREISMIYQTEKFQSHTRWHLILAKKYERAASYPWLSAEPEPPEPK
jgi:hypothetical protein